MDAGRVEMTSSPLVGTSAVDTHTATRSPDMESIRGIEVTSLSTGRRATEAAGFWIIRLYVVSIRAVITALAVVSGTAQYAGRVIHKRILFLL